MRETALLLVRGFLEIVHSVDRKSGDGSVAVFLSSTDNGTGTAILRVD